MSKGRAKLGHRIERNFDFDMMYLNDELFYRERLFLKGPKPFAKYIKRIGCPDKIKAKVSTYHFGYTSVPQSQLRKDHKQMHFML